MEDVNTFSRPIQSDIASHYNVRAATEKDTAQICDIIQSECRFWPCDPNLIKSVIEVFPGAFVVGEDIKTKNIVGMLSGIQVDDEIGVAGNYIVRKDARGRGLGNQMCHRLSKTCGDRNLIIDSVPEMVNVYEKIGFHRFGSTVSVWNGKIRNGTSLHDFVRRSIEIKVATESSLPEISQYDRKIYPACRDWFFRRCLLNVTGVSVRLAVEESEVVGYGFTRLTPNKFYANTTYANDVDIAKMILESTILDMPDGAELTVCIPDDNEHATSLAEEIGLESVMHTIKMCTKEPPQFPWSEIFFANPADLLLY